MNKWQLYIVSIILIILISVLYGFSSMNNAKKKLSKIEVYFEENKALFLTTEIVNKLLIQSDEHLLSKAKSKINLYELEERLNKNHMIENAEVYYAPDGILEVKVTQRVPLARVHNGKTSYYIDRQGINMPLSSNYTARVPLVTGVYGKEIEKECFQLINKIHNDDFLKKQIIGIHRKTNGDYLLSTRIGRHKILFGKLDNTKQKIKKLKIFYKKEWKSKALKEYKLVNLKYDKQVVCSI